MTCGTSQVLNKHPRAVADEVEAEAVTSPIDVSLSNTCSNTNLVSQCGCSSVPNSGLKLAFNQLPLSRLLNWKRRRCRHGIGTCSKTVR